jgi:hypothetical protein
MRGQLFRSGTHRGFSMTHLTWQFCDSLSGTAPCVCGARGQRGMRRYGTSRLHDEGCPVRDGFPQRPGHGREELVGVIRLLKESHGAEGHGVGA